MNMDRYKDIDAENIDIAKKIKKDSENIKLNQITDKKIINKIRNSKKKRTFKEKVYKAGMSVAACIVLIAGILVWNRAQTGDVVNKAVGETKTELKLSSTKNITSNVSSIGKVANSYGEVKEKLKRIMDRESLLNQKNAYMETSALDINQNSAVNRGTDSFSATNIQTAGVDEGDIVKTDGQYIYRISESPGKNGRIAYKIIITKVSGKKMKKVSEINISDKVKGKNSNVTEMYVEGEKLVVIVSDAGDYLIGECVGEDSLKKSGYDDNSETSILIYDISDIYSAKLISKNKQDGYFNTSRLADGYLYTVSSWNVNDISKQYIPEVNGNKMECSRIYMPNVSDNTTYAVITTIDINKAKDIKDSKAILGNASKVYVSNENIYLLNEEYDEKDISHTKEGKKIIKQYKSKRQINTNNQISDKEKERIRDSYEDSNYDLSKISKKFEITIIEYSNKMEILKYVYKDGVMTFTAGCNLEGRTDDRFSLDEKDGYLRVVSHVNQGRYLNAKYIYYDADEKEIEMQYYDNKTLNGEINSNTVYTLDEKLNKRGEISGLAENEDIYAARYLGNYGYFVTYEQTDPLFTVDFTDMDNPKISGELKMPGFSDYLQCYNENLMLGIGVNVENTGEQNLKMDMYNVSKKSAARKTTLTLYGAVHSAALYEPKALLMDSEKNIIGFPVSYGYDTQDEYTEKDYYILFSYKKGKFHELLKLNIGEYVGEYTRALYINDYLYIVTPEKIFAVNMNNIK